MDSLLRKSEESKNATDDAVKSINDSFEKAKKTLETLENFDEVLKNNKEKAREALTLETEINANLKELEDKLDDTNKLTSELNNKIQQASRTNQRVGEKLKEKVKIPYVLCLNHLFLKFLFQNSEELKTKASKLNVDSKSLHKKVLENIESNKNKLDSANDTLEVYNNMPNKLSDLLLKSQEISNKTRDLLNHVFDSQDLLNKVEKTKLGLILFLYEVK
jgi:DNA repair ATPase RecN